MKTLREMRVTGALLLVAVGLVARRGGADEITLRADHDATIYEEDGARGDGGGAALFVGKNRRGRRRALFSFDVAGALPPGAVIEGVTLRLSLTRTRSAAADLELYSVTQAWTEGRSRGDGNEGGGAPAVGGDVTWTHRSWDTAAWTTKGGDYSETPVGKATVGSSLSSYEWSDAAMVADVQHWLDQPASNFGWILVGEQDGPKRFGSRAGQRDSAPMLAVSYRAPSQPTGACCRADGTCGIVLDPGTTCQGKYTGAASVCSPDPCPPPVGACCHPDVAATCTVGAEIDCGAAGAKWQGPATLCAADACPVVLPRFVDPLPLPAIATPVGDAGAEAHYRIAMKETRQKLHRDLPPTAVWGLDDGTTGPSYPGPTIEAQRGQPIQVTWVNDLRDAGGTLRTTHYLPVDHCLHGAESDAPRTVIHLHGGHVPSAYDGQPELTLLPGDETTYEYPNNQLAATLWYHDHSLGITRLNVIMGLAGYYVLRDPEEEKLDLPRGKYDVPLVVQDRSFKPDGSFRYPAVWDEHAFGDTLLVNGKVWPYLRVDQGRYRFRLLNGSTSRTYTLSLSSGELFLQIGTDGGLQKNPTAISWITIAPGERAEVVVDFSRHRSGEEIVLKNSAAAPFPSGMQENRIDDVMKFVVTRDEGFTDPVPLELRQIVRLDEKNAVETRDFELKREAEGCGGSMWMINGKHWSDITERPHLGTTEVWRFINRSGFMHPMHMHLVMFQVLDHQRFHLDGDKVVLDGDAMLPGSSDVGWKDTVQVQPFEVLRVIARFEDYVGRFPYHCHVLEHEDNEMMRQYETVSECGDGVAVKPLEECDDGNVADGDGCSSECKFEHDGGTPDAGVDAGTALPDASVGRKADAVPGPADASSVHRKHTADGVASPSCGCRASRSAPASMTAFASIALLGVITLRRSASRRRLVELVQPGGAPCSLRRST